MPLPTWAVAEAAVSHHACDAAFHQARHQDRARGGGTRVLAAVHDQHRTGRAILDRLALRMAAVAEYVDLVEVLAHAVFQHGHFAKNISRPDL